MYYAYTYVYMCVCPGKKWWATPVIFISIQYRVVWESLSMVLSTKLILDNVHVYNTRASTNVNFFYKFSYQNIAHD